MKKICYLLVILITIGLVSCQESEVAENVPAHKGHIAVGVSLSGGMQDLILKSPAQVAPEENVYGGYIYDNVIPDDIFIIMASWTNDTGNGHKLFVLDARAESTESNPSLDMEMFYGENKITFKAYGVATCEDLIQDYISNGGNEYPDLVNILPFDEYIASWKLFVNKLNDDIEEYATSIEDLGYDFIGRKSVIVTAVNSSATRAENTINDLVLFRMISQLNFVFESVLADLEKYPEFSWEFVIETAKMKKDLSGDEYDNLDCDCCDCLRCCTFLSEGILGADEDFYDLLNRVDAINACHVTISNQAGIVINNGACYALEGCSADCTEIHSTCMCDNSYGAIRLTYLLHTPGGDITGVVKNIIGGEERSEPVSTEVLNLFLLNTRYLVDFNLNEEIYTDDALNGKFQLVFKGLIGKNASIVISDTENTIGD